MVYEEVEIVQATTPYKRRLGVRALRMCLVVCETKALRFYCYCTAGPNFAPKHRTIVDIDFIQACAGHCAYSPCAAVEWMVELNQTKTGQQLLWDALASSSSKIHRCSRYTLANGGEGRVADTGAIFLCSFLAAYWVQRFGFLFGQLLGARLACQTTCLPNDLPACRIGR